MLIKERLIWVAGSLSKRQMKQLTRRTESYPMWVVGVSLGLPCLGGTIVGTIHNATLFANIFGLTCLVIVWPILWMVTAPLHRARLLNRLRQEGVVFTPDDLPYQLLMPVIHRCNKSEDGRSWVSSLMFAMYELGEKYGENWLLTGDWQARFDWASLVTTLDDGPFNRILKTYVCKRDLLANIDHIVSENRQKFIQDLDEKKPNAEYVLAELAYQRRQLASA
jgi:hypothetical protein